MLKVYPLPNSLFSASKWSEISVLLSVKDWEEVLFFLEKAFFFSLKSPVSASLEIAKENLIEAYKKALFSLKDKREDFSSWTQVLPLAITVEKEAFFFVKTPTDKTLIQWRKPAILLQPFFFHYSPLDETFRPKILGKEKVFWGMQFSFPYVYYEPILKEIKKVDLKTEKNGLLFLELRRKIRSLTHKANFSLGKGGDFRKSETGLEEIFPHFQLEKKGIYAS